ncbi:hypothetical protein MMC13_006945 [Lambiella insularis]|nr:hypothetical protein [Lambiella insularis]
MLCFPTLIGESLQSYLTGWRNCRVLPKNAKTSNVGMIVVYQGRQQTFEDICNCLEAYGPELPALIISPSSTKWKRVQISSQSQRFVHRILEPFGPNKITKALLTCLGRPRVLQRPERHRQETWSQNLADAKDLTEANTQQSNELTALDNEVSASEHRTRKVVNPEDTRTRASSTTASRWKETQTADTSLDMVAPPIDRKQIVRIPDRGDSTDAVIPPVSGATVRENNKRSPSLLLVDDNEVNLKILKTFMEKSGYHDIETATNGLLAVREVENRAGGFEVIVMDISMPIMDGLQATREIRRLEHERFDSSSSTAPTPRPALVVALTGLASAKEQKEALRSGFNSFITKPMRFESLKEILADWESSGPAGDAGGMEEGEGKEGKDSDALTARARIQR